MHATLKHQKKTVPTEHIPTRSAYGWPTPTPTESNHASLDGDIIAANTWAKQLGRTPVTIWRWCRNGWLSPINISGRPYLRRDDIEQFIKRAQAGEFHKEPKGAAKRKAVAL